MIRLVRVLTLTAVLATCRGGGDAPGETAAESAAISRGADAPPAGEAAPPSDKGEAVSPPVEGDAAPPAVSDASPPVPGAVPVSLSVVLGGESIQASGSGECHYAAQASIYGVRAAMWSVTYSHEGGSGLRHANLTVWRPADGSPEQLSLYLGTASAQHTISTVRGGELVGEGTVTVQPHGSGGRFEIAGKDANGAPIRASIDCERFTEPEVVAG